MQYLIPDWDAPDSVRAYCTTRIGGVSSPPYDSFNLASHVGDNVRDVTRNRALLTEQLQLPAEPDWLTQVHGNKAVEAAHAQAQPEADAAFTSAKHRVCAVLTADCLPVLFCDQAGSCVAVAHAGWRGLAAGVLEAAVSAMPAQATDIMVWLGPAIGPGSFEVGTEVREAFVQTDLNAEQAFKPSVKGCWFADLYLLARLRLAKAGVKKCFGGGLCTFKDVQRFYSYRRDGVTGRMASLIWLD